MELTSGNVVVRFLLFSLLIAIFRFAYVIIIAGDSCHSDTGFCFFSSTSPEYQNLLTTTTTAAGHLSSLTVNPTATSSPASHTHIMFYITVFQDLIIDGFLTTKSKSLCVNSPAGVDVYALNEIGVHNSVGIYENKKLGFQHDNAFDFIFSGDRVFNISNIERMLKPEGYVVIHTTSNDSYSFNSFIRLFNCCDFIRSREIDGFDSNMPYIQEIVMKKQKQKNKIIRKPLGNSCLVPGYKQALLNKAESLIEIEPLKPWITLKQNLENVKYLPLMADISFKRRYVYIDVGARSYGSSIVSWFKKQYPKQNKTFEIYAIEADSHFHNHYTSKKDVTLLPYAAWVKNESLVFEINQTPGDEKGRGMGRIRPVKPGGGIVGSTDVIRGFDFADWLKNTVTENDFVVMKMDVEGTEFDLFPRLIETGAICLIDELFLECHYNRWQKCCPGVRSPKYEKTYGQCLNLFKSLRHRGILVHQWW